MESNNTPEFVYVPVTEEEQISIGHNVEKADALGWTGSRYGWPAPVPLSSLAPATGRWEDRCRNEVLKKPAANRFQEGFNVGVFETIEWIKENAAKLDETPSKPKGEQPTEAGEWNLEICSPGLWRITNRSPKNLEDATEYYADTYEDANRLKSLLNASAGQPGEEAVNLLMWLFKKLELWHVEGEKPSKEKAVQLYQLFKTRGK